MFIRKLKRICDVRGCRCRDTFSISMSREAGNTIIACRKCLKNALVEIERLYPKEKKIEETDVGAEMAESTASELPPSFASQNPPPSEMEAGEMETGYSEDELLDGMTIKELKAFADEIGIDVSRCKVKVDFIEAIKAASKVNE